MSLRESWQQHSTPAESPDAAPPLSAEQTVEARYVHPATLTLFKKAPFLRYVPVLGLALEGFGPKFIVAIALCQFLCKGTADALINISRYPMFVERFGANAVEYQRMASMYMMGWSLRPFVATLSDVFALFGYTKRWYCAASCVIGAAVAVGYALLPAEHSSLNMAAALLFLTTFGKANVDILVEGHYSRLLRRRPESGPALVSWVWGTIMFAGIVAAFVQGPLSDLGKPQIGVLVSASLQFVTVVFFVFNWMEEKTNRHNRAEDERLALERLAKGAADDVPLKKVSSDDEVAEGNAVEAEVSDMVGFSNAAEPAFTSDPPPSSIYPCLCGAVEVNVEVAKRNRMIVLMSTLVTLGTVGMTVVTILGTRQDRLIACVSISVFLMGFGFYALPRLVAKTNLFIFVFFLLYVQLPGALDTFYLSGPECLADGPHFSKFFYNTMGGVVGSIGGIFGLLLSTYFFSKRSYRVAFIFTTGVQIVASVFDIIIVKRWNVKIGINDHVMYILGDGVVYNTTYMLAALPVMLLMSRVCPKGVESIIFALVAGCANLAQGMSATIGATLMEYAFPVISEPPCDFSNVPMLILVGHFIMPLGTIALAFFLVPSARICDEIDVDGNVVPKPEDSHAMAETAKSGDCHEPNTEKVDK